MATLKEALITALKAESTITALVGSRVFPNHPARGALRPCLVVLVASDVRGQSVGGHTPQRIARVLLDCQAATDATAESIARALDSYLPTLGQTTISGLSVKTCIQQSESDTYTQPGTGGDVGVYSRVLDYRFDYRLQS